MEERGKTTPRHETEKKRESYVSNNSRQEHGTETRTNEYGDDAYSRRRKENSVRMYYVSMHCDFLAYIMRKDI